MATTARRSRGDGPWLLVLETISSHLPWANPEGGPNAEEPIIRFVDREAAAFCRGLIGDGFTRDNLLVVTSDHRAMTAMSREEVLRLGAAQARSRIPLFVAGPGVRPGRVDTPFQQTDLAPSLRWLTSPGRATFEARQGNIFDPSRPPSIIVHQQGGDRNMLDVFLPPEQRAHQVRLDGDATRGLDPVDPEVIRAVNYARLAGR